MYKIELDQFKLVAQLKCLIILTVPHSLRKTVDYANLLLTVIEQEFVTLPDQLDLVVTQRNDSSKA